MNSKSSPSTLQIPPLIQQVNRQAARFPKVDVVHRTLENETIDGRTLRVANQELLHFGNASYLGLESDPRIKRAAMQTIERYGVQFSSSRAYVQLPLYEQLESLLEQIFKRPVVVTPSTTLGHLSVVPLFFQPDDLVVIDYQAHASMQTVVQIARGNGVHVEHLRHNDMNRLESLLRERGGKFGKVWYMADGVYSMYGDMLDGKALTDLMQRYENLYLYVDDAHGMSWTGKHGAGVLAEQMELTDRVFLVTSLNKGFGAGGGVIVCPNAEVKTWLRRAGPSLVFSGPVQPSALGAAIASAEIHLSSEIGERQRKIKANIDRFLRKADEYRVPLADSGATPIFFITLGKQALGVKLCSLMREAGFYTNLGIFPAVPINRTGMRVSINWHLKSGDIDRMLQTLGQLLPRALEEEKVSLSWIEQRFRLDASLEAA